MLAKEIRLREDAIGKEFDFWVFADEDLDIQTLSNVKASDWQGWGSFFDYLVDDMPFNATMATVAHWRPLARRISVSSIDALLTAFPRKFVPYFIPYVTLGPSESQWHSQACLFCIMSRCFKSSAVYAPHLLGTNPKHRDYDRGLSGKEIFQTLQQNFDGYNFDVGPCHKLPVGIQNLNLVGPYVHRQS
jgi:hypothetical protein